MWQIHTDDCNKYCVYTIIMPNFKRFFFFLLFLIPTSYILLPMPVQAAITACSVSVSPNTINSGSSDTLVFNVTNDDEAGNQLHWVKISVPSSNFTITSGDGPSNGGVEIASDGSYVIVKTTMSGGETGAFSIGVTAGGSSGTASFGVSVSDVSEGDNPVGCGGDASVTVPETAQTIQNSSNISVSVTDSSANITWSTSQSAVGSIDYGTSTSYGSQVSESGATTSHSLTLSSLSANTTYHFRITTGGTQFSDSTFKTAVSGTTTTTTVTNTVTTVVTSKTQTDTNGPVISISTNFEKPFESSPEIIGKAVDPSRIVKIEYSTDGGVDWLPVDSTSLGEKNIKFSFVPDSLDDGNYKIIVRAMDGAGNIGKSKIYNLVIDRLPPLVGGNIWSIGSIPILPDENGVLIMLAGVDHKITMSAVGGPLSINLLIGSSNYSMTRSNDSGLWSGVVNFDLPGSYIVKVKSVDGAGNETVRNLNSILVIDSGRVTESSNGNIVTNARVSIYQQDELSKIWSLWDGVSFGQKNPQVVTGTGSYSYFLPAGTYYLKVTALGYKSVTSKIFNITSPTIINTDILLAKGWWFNPFKSINITVNKDKLITKEQNSYPLVDTESPSFTLPSVGEKELNLLSLRGKNRVLVFLNTWLPSTSEQISQIKSLPTNYKEKITVVMMQESISKAAVFAKKGGYYDLTIVADNDGILINPYRVNSLPSSYFIDRKGLIKKVVTGVVSTNEIISILDSI